MSATHATHFRVEQGLCADACGEDAIEVLDARDERRFERGVLRRRVCWMGMRAEVIVEVGVEVSAR